MKHNYPRIILLVIAGVGIASGGRAEPPPVISTTEFPAPTNRFANQVRDNVIQTRNALVDFMPMTGIARPPLLSPMNFPLPSPAMDPFEYNAQNFIVKNRQYIIDNYNLSQQNQADMNTNFAALDKISYDNGTLTFGSGDSNSRAADKTIQLFNPESTNQSTEALNQEVLYNRSAISTVNQKTTDLSQQLTNTMDALSQQLSTSLEQYNSLPVVLDKYARAISVNAAFAALPSGYMTNKNFIGFGVGHFDKHTGFAVGLTRSFDCGFIIQGRYGMSGKTSVLSAAAGIGF